MRNDRPVPSNLPPISHHDGRQIGDLVSVGVIAGVANDWLPALASLFAVLWTLIRIFEWVRHRFVLKKPEPFE